MVAHARLGYVRLYFARSPTLPFLAHPGLHCHYMYTERLDEETKRVGRQPSLAMEFYSIAKFGDLTFVVSIVFSGGVDEIWV